MNKARRTLWLGFCFCNKLLSHTTVKQLFDPEKLFSFLGTVKKDNFILQV